ncbi:respiratory nitrate reductase subunit gamma [Streptomyces zagrosensis]
MLPVRGWKSRGAAGHAWRYQKDRFGSTSHASQLLKRRWLRRGSPYTS